MSKIFIAVPRYNVIESETEEFLKYIIGTIKDNEIVDYKEILGMSSISISRGMLIKEFLATKADHILFVDTDMTWIIDTTKEIINPIDRLVKHNVDIISGVMTTRHAPIRPCFTPIDKNSYAETKKIFEVSHTGTGFMLITRYVIEYLLRWYPSLFLPIYDEKLKIETSDDVAFCYRARKNHFKIWVDPDIIIGHLGKYAYSVNDIKESMIELSKT